MTEPRTVPLRLAALSLSAAVLLTACGGDGEGQSAEDEQESIPSPTLEGGEDQAEGGDSGDDEEGGSAVPDEDEIPDRPASNTTGFSYAESITEPSIFPKSVVSNGRGLAIANNMIYRNSSTLYDTEERELVQELDATLSPADFGVDGYPDEVTGAPVEAVWTEDGEYAYVSQYRFRDYGADAYDDCRNGDAVEPTALFRYSVEEGDWDDFIEVGRVPKYLAVTPDASTLLVSNWCDHDLSVVDAESGETTERIRLNSQPRGIAPMPDNQTVYVTAMYADEIYEVDLETGEAEMFYNQGERPRHLVLSPEGDVLYATFSGSDQIVAFDTETNEVIDSTPTGREPRTMDISADGTALFAANYYDNTISKFDAETLDEIETLPAGEYPIGVTYDELSGTVWVSNYHDGGALMIFDDTVEQ
ncbi:beta-propeller fold lactonase family protein [Nesterenkonia populi]